MFFCTWLLQQTAAMLQADTTFRGRRWKRNCKFGICALSCAQPHFGRLLYCHRFVQYGVRNCETTLMQLWECFTVSPLRSACLVMHHACKTRWWSSEVIVRARSEILVIWSAWKQLSENINKAMCVVLLRLIKTINFNMVLSFCQYWHFTWQNWATFFRRDVLILHTWKLPYISSLMPLLNPSLS